MQFLKKRAIIVQRRKSTARTRLAITLLFMLTTLSSNAQTDVAPIVRFPLDGNPLMIRQLAQANRPFSVTGQRGAILGQQDGTFELWLLPVKMLHKARLIAQLQGYDAVIQLNDYASQIEVRPDHTTITYSHAAITVKQHMFIPRSAQSGIATAVVLFEIHAIRPATVTLQFEPSMERMWPAPNFGRPDSAWTSIGTGGIYTLGTDNPNFFGMIAMPASTHGLLSPYQERPQTLPLEFNINYDPARDNDKFFPLLAAVTGVNGSPELSHQQLQQQVLLAAKDIPSLYHSTASFYDHFFDTRLTVETPDAQLNDALRWAEVSIEQAKVASAHGAGLAGGWFTSGDSARPGFGWFFGRDTLWTLYAVNSYGDFGLSREAMDFLLAHQRADGKMMHEVSQTADLVDWNSLPYQYASADSTPLFVMQMEDYVRASGDLAYLRSHWDKVKRAYAFTRAHTTNGAYDNSQGTGWVEEWVPKPPAQEIYLVALDEQSCEAMGRLAKIMSDDSLSTSATQAAGIIRNYLATYRNTDGFYNFSHNTDGTFETQPTVFPTVAWWSGHLTLPQADDTFDTWASPKFSTDWGMRSMAEGATTYDPISYHHGSVWPLYTGWTSLAEYRTGRPIAAYANLQQNVQLTWLQDPGAITEVLSGKFYQPLGRSSSHQLWSSAMVLTPAIRGMLGLEADVPAGRLRVDPELPAEWSNLSVQNVPYGDLALKVEMHRQDTYLNVEVISPKPLNLCLQNAKDFFANIPCVKVESTRHHLRLPLPPIELSLEWSPPIVGSEVSQWKIIRQIEEAHSLKIVLQAKGGTSQRLYLRTNGQHRNVQVVGAQRSADWLTVTSTSGDGYVEQAVSITWDQ
jgi:glycogen debranching enzyme